MSKTEISWTQHTWGPVRGCRRVSPGCGGGTPGPNKGGCYAEAMAARIVRMGGYEWIDGAWRDDPTKKHNPTARAQADKYKALVRINKDGEARWTGTFAFDPEKLSEPLRRKAPTMYFVNSMSDLFGEGLTNEQIAAVFGVMASCGHHVFQVLTKRPARMVEWFKWLGEHPHEKCAVELTWREDVPLASPKGRRDRLENMPRGWPWPLPNVWIGVSVERQQEADERIPLLLQCPAAVRWISAEPLLGPVDLRAWLGDAADVPPEYTGPADKAPGYMPGLSWVVTGGESGHSARPCDMQWIRDIGEQCREAGVPWFNKQLGAHVILDCPDGEVGLGQFREDGSARYWTVDFVKDKKGADPAEWPADLRVREWPRGFTPPPSKAPKNKALPMVTP